MPRLPRSACVTAAALAFALLATAPAAGDGPAVSDPRVLAHFDLAGDRHPRTSSSNPTAPPT